MLKGLRAALQNLPVLGQIADHRVIARKTQPAATVFLDFRIGFAPEATGPVLLTGGRGNAVDLPEDSACLKPQRILICRRKSGDDLVCVCAVDPSIKGLGAAFP